MKIHLKIYICRVLFIIILSLILALPWPIISTRAKLSELGTDIRTEEILTSVDSVAPIFSNITGIKLLPMGKKLCLNNKNQILFDGIQKDKSEVLDKKEGGSMGFAVYYPGKKVELYAKLGESNCINLDSNFDKATTTNTVSIRSVFPVEVLLENTDSKPVLKIKTATTSEVDFSRSTITEKVIFNIYVYLKNTFLVLIGMLILISTYIQIHPFIIRDNDR